MNEQVSSYIDSHRVWHAALRELRLLLLNFPLQETFKWRAPCYTFEGKNVVLLGALRDCCVLSFVKGVLLQDADQVLVAPGKHSRSVRVIRFAEVEEVLKRKSVVKRLVKEAIELEKQGAKIDLSAAADLPVPAELQSRFDEHPLFAKAFEALTPGRQRAYLMHFSNAKQSATRLERIDKFTDRILDGKGLNDCVCGLSSRMPACDGSHKTLRTK